MKITPSRPPRHQSIPRPLIPWCESDAFALRKHCCDLRAFLANGAVGMGTDSTSTFRLACVADVTLRVLLTLTSPSAHPGPLCREGIGTVACPYHDEVAACISKRDDYGRAHDACADGHPSSRTRRSP